VNAPWSGSITDTSGNIWTISSGNQVVANGVVDASTSVFFPPFWMFCLIINICSERGDVGIRAGYHLAREQGPSLVWQTESHCCLGCPTILQSDGIFSPLKKIINIYQCKMNINSGTRDMLAATWTTLTVFVTCLLFRQILALLYKLACMFPLATLLLPVHSPRKWLALQ
jgi:hypothetical protein